MEFDNIKRRNKDEHTEAMVAMESDIMEKMKMTEKIHKTDQLLGAVVLPHYEHLGAEAEKSKIMKKN